MEKKKMVRNGEMSVDKSRRWYTESSRENTESRATEGAVHQNRSCVYNNDRECTCKAACLEGFEELPIYRNLA